MAEISDEMYEELRQILEKQSGHAYTLEDAKEIGDGLIGFYILLLELSESTNDPLRLNGNLDLGL